jgi:glutamate-1-semialdehyde aminotransferase
MVKQSKDPLLRKAIRAELLAIHKLNQRIDRGAITAKYTKQKPKRAEYISDIVEGYELITLLASSSEPLLTAVQLH